MEFPNADPHILQELRQVEQSDQLGTRIAALALRSLPEPRYSSDADVDTSSLHRSL
jgi:hypothetical protein